MTVGATLETLLESSPSLARTLPGIERAAASGRPLLVLGEPGTGKSVLARACHLASPRHTEAVVEVDVGAVPSSLFESELFGHVAGAFTGASTANPGRVARADGSTLILDRVEMLPTDCQPKLLRVLAEQRYSPLGGDETHADVRFIAVGAANLAERVQQGRFRADLYYRLEVFAFVVPPLRARLDDLDHLAEAMLDDAAQRLACPSPTLGPKARAWMQRHTWPGNLRELRNVLERAMLEADGAVLEPPDPGPKNTEPETLATIERAHILRTLAFTRGHQGQAARLLGISRKALWEKRKRFGIP